MKPPYDVIVIGGGTAGAMAALSAQSGRDPAALPMADIHALLAQHGAMVPEEKRNHGCGRND